MSITIRDAYGYIEGYQCRRCENVFRSMWGDLCDGCREDENRHREIIAAIRATDRSGKPGAEGEDLERRAGPDEGGERPNQSSLPALLQAGDAMCHQLEYNERFNYELDKEDLRLAAEWRTARAKSLPNHNDDGK